MERRWRWPPETLDPPWLISEAKPPSRSSMKSLACAMRAASRMFSSVTDSPANLRFDSTVPEKSMPCWGIYPTRRRSSESGRSRTSMPSSRIWPPVTSYRRGISCTSGRLARTRGADDAKHLAGAYGKAHAADDVLASIGVLEAHAAEFKLPVNAVCRRELGSAGAADRSSRWRAPPLHVRRRPRRAAA